ncbi:MAG: alanine--tRNA ligase [Candidatus Marinimicrobia bacterium]|nr:alanine--tRNA ligase [Candidatus Neomarinimicrobiota bacterium]|tara:strand:- start:2780 stop:5374 length:2595 start_codon:yes stop_codon:yes gene_type:complete
MKASEIRNRFFEFFGEREHIRVRSASLIPVDDPTLLFINAGMNQFKSIFLEKEQAKHLRVVNSQKCIRVSGKHNDLEEVGYDTYHHTFFEMLGNWSFGDYYKSEAIEWAWEMFTNVLGLDKDRLWATVYEEDDETCELWKQVTDIPHERVLRFGKKYNFWEMGETGPCGPCSEIHYYVGEDTSSQNAEGVNTSDEYWELWNLVFIQNNRLIDGKLEDLPKKHVDTGAGLERIAAVMQGKSSNYDTDLFRPIIIAQEKVLGVSYQDNLVAHRAIADHVRMLTFSIADGVLPSNEGRGYVARRILRRAARFGRSMGMEKPFLTTLVDSVVELMSDAYPEVSEKKAHVKNVIKAEEENFNETLDRGLEKFERIVSDLEGKTISGDSAFKLYDTFGFPLDLTVQMARERELDVNCDGFDEAMEEQKEKGRREGKFKMDVSDFDWTTVTNGSDSQFVGYTESSTEASVRRFHSDPKKIVVILNKTPFYGEQGGQVGDTGTISGDGFEITVTDTIKEGEIHLHIGKWQEGDTISSPKVTAAIDTNRRAKIRKNHTATHLLHRALKKVLGEHVQQAGSLVHPDYLRFDLTHPQKVGTDELKAIEKMVNEQILLNIKLNMTVTSFNDAKKKGAEAIFEEKYGNEVRMVTIEGFSKELCGGTHVDRTGDIGFFKITEESSLASGVRRIVAVTGHGAVDYIMDRFEQIDTVKSLLNCGESDIAERVEALMDQRKKLDKELKQQRTSESRDALSSIIGKARDYNGIQIAVDQVKVSDGDDLKQIGDWLRQELKRGIGVLGALVNNKPLIVCVVTDDLVTEGSKANDLVKMIGAELGGGGGGKAHLATAGGKDPGKLREVLQKSADIIIEKLKGDS